MNKREEGIKALQSYALRTPRVRGQGMLSGHFTGAGARQTESLAVVKDPAQFDGMPAWFACQVRRDAYGRMIPYGRWMPQAITGALQAVDRLLHGVGNPARERVYRTNHSLCLVRCLTGAEWEALPLEFHNAEPIILDGGPIEVLRETWPGRPATKPCSNPGRRQLPDETDPMLWEPVDCGQCAPCLDRAGMESERARVEREKEEREAMQAWAATDEGRAWLARQVSRKSGGA